MSQERGAPQVDGSASQAEQRCVANFVGIPPVVKVAIDAHEGEAETKAGPKQGAEPVDAQQGDVQRLVPRADEYHHRNHHQSEQSGHDPLHVFPLPIEGRVDGRNAGELNGAVDNDIDVAEENRHIAHGCEPELNGGVAGKGGLHAKPAGHEAACHQHRDAIGVGADEVGNNQHAARREQLDASRKAELYAEHDREVDRHAYERGKSGHHDVFLHQGGGANHVGGGSEVDAARQLYYHHKNDEQPGFESSRDERRYVGDVERS